MKGPIVGVYCQDLSYVIFLDVTKIVFFTRATNKVYLVSGIELTFDENEMVKIMDKLNDIYSSNP